MKCKHCNGDGFIIEVNHGYADKYMCDHCLGTGIIEPMTNDEWRRTCSAEEFADWSSNLAYACMRCGMSNGEAYCYTGYCIQDKEGAEKWLKEKNDEM